MTKPITESHKSDCTATAISSATLFCRRTETTLCPARGTRLCACGIWPSARLLAVSKTIPRCAKVLLILTKDGNFFREIVQFNGGTLLILFRALVIIIRGGWVKLFEPMRGRKKILSLCEAEEFAARTSHMCRPTAFPSLHDGIISATKL